MNFLLYFLIAVFSYETNGATSYLPPYIKPCDVRETSRAFEECIKEQMQVSVTEFTKGIPELGVPSLDPVDLEDIIIDGKGLKLSISKAKMYGLSNSTVTSMNIDIKSGDFRLEFNTNFKVLGKYKIEGRILILPVEGDGDANIFAKNTTVEIRNKLSFDDKKEHFKLVKPSFKYNIDKTIFKFENLFRGNKQISEATHRFANENWEQIMDDLAPPAIQQIVKTCVKAINKFFSKVSITQIVHGWTPNKQ